MNALDRCLESCTKFIGILYKVGHAKVHFEFYKNDNFCVNAYVSRYRDPMASGVSQNSFAEAVVNLQKRLIKSGKEDIESYRGKLNRWKGLFENWKWFFKKKSISESKLAFGIMSQNIIR